MSLDNEEDARKFIAETEEMLSNIDNDGDKLYNHFKLLFGEVTDFDSFKNFYFNYLSKCPNQDIVKNYNKEEDAKKLWFKIDVNRNGTLDINEGKLLVKAIIIHAKLLTKKFFHIHD